MPPKTFTCKICGKEVSKRKSWSYEGGRVCREHEEAQEAKAAALADDELKEAADELKEAVDEMQVISMTAATRTAHTMHDVPVQVMLTRFQLSGTPARILKRVREEVDRLGPRMSDDELAAAAGNAIEMKRILEGAGE